MKPEGSWRRAQALAYVVVALVVSYQALRSRDAIRFLVSPDKLANWAFEARPPVFQVREAGGGLLVGDRVLAIDGKTVHGVSDMMRPLTSRMPGDKIPLTVKRGDQTLQVESVIGRARPSMFDGTERAIVLITFFITGWVSILLGCFAIVQRPNHRLAWLMLGMLLGFAQLSSFGDMALAFWPKPLAVAGTIYHHFAMTTWAIWMMWFGLDFPDPQNPRRFLAWLRWPFTVPLLLMAVYQATVAVWRLVDIQALRNLMGGRPPVIPTFWLTALPIGLFFANLAYKAAVETNPDARRRLRLLLHGAYISLTPMFILLLSTFFRRQRDFLNYPPWLWIPPVALLIVFPLTLAYVIVVERAMDLGVVVRQGLQYAFASRGVTVLRISLIGIAILRIIHVSQSPDVDQLQSILEVIVLALFILGVRKLADRLKAWVDRRFFREAIDTEHVLAELSDEVRRIVGIQPLLETVTQRVSEALHVPRVVALLPSNGVFAPVHALGFAGGLPEVRLEGSGAAARRLLTTGGPLKVYWEDPKSWVNRDLSLGREHEELKKLDPQLLLPVTARQELVGVLALGPKQSEAAYTPSDLRLLQSVAVQTGFAFENTRLTEVVAHETAQREIIYRELEIAKEVQERLFPQVIEPVAGVEYAGRCRPAQSVGGDYYDYFTVDGLAYFVVGDVAGKGIPAALLMASLQSSLRGLVAGGARDLGDLMTKLNRLIHAASPRNRFATMFLGQYEPVSRTLSYAAAGHNPPLLLRAAGQPEWLKAQGLALGLTRSAKYVPCTTVLQPGDRIAIYSDGISEAMSSTMEEFGDDRLIAAVRASVKQPASPSIASIFAAVDQHAAGTPQHDDMTLIILQITGSPQP